MAKEVIRMDENTWRIEDDGVRFFLFCGSKKAALIDTGMNCPDAKDIAEGLTDLPLILINTHADPDHISGNAKFEEFYMSPEEEENYREHNGIGKLIPIKEGDIIDLGNRPLEIIDIPGHTPGSVAILDKNNRILVSGDTVQDDNIFMFGKMRNMDVYIESLKHLEEYEGLYDEIYPMHGSIPVKSDLIGKLIKGANDIRDGKAQYSQVSVHGQDVSHYGFEYAGFLCDPE